VADDFLIEEYDKKDRAACIKLLETTFPGTSNEDTFRWRFENPDRKKPILICAKDKDEVISFNSWIPWEFSYENEIFLGYQSGESATDVRYRGKGLFSQILQSSLEIAKNQEVDFFIGFPGRMSYGSFLRIGYYPIATFYHRLRPLNPFKMLRKEPIINKYKNYNQSTMVGKTMITPVVNDEYLRWRYDENPKHYDVYEFIEDNCRAIFYTRKNIWKGLPIVILLDVQFTSYNDMFVRRAFEYLDTILSRKAILIRTLFNGNSERGKILNKYFPINIKSKYFVLLAMNISKRIPLNDFYNYNRWEIMPHCIDHY